MCLQAHANSSQCQLHSPAAFSPALHALVVLHTPNRLGPQRNRDCCVARVTYYVLEVLANGIVAQATPFDTVESNYFFDIGAFWAWPCLCWACCRLR